MAVTLKKKEKNYQITNEPRMEPPIHELNRLSAAVVGAVILVL